MQSYKTRTIVIKDNNQTKLLHYTQPANIIRIDTLSDDTNKAISQATNDFQEIVANTFGAYTTTATIYNLLLLSMNILKQSMNGSTNVTQTENRQSLSSKTKTFTV